MKLFAALLTTLFVVGSYSKPLEEDADYDQVSETLERASDQVNAVLEDLERVSAQLDADAAANDGEEVQMAKRSPHDPRLDFEKLKDEKNIVNGHVKFADAIKDSYIVIVKSQTTTEEYIDLMNHIEEEAQKRYPDGVDKVFVRNKKPLITAPMNGAAFGFFDMREFEAEYKGDSTETIAHYHTTPDRKGREKTGFRGFFIGANEDLASYASELDAVLLVERNMIVDFNDCAQPVEPAACNWGKSRLNYDEYRENASMGFDANARGYWTLAAADADCQAAGLMYDSDAAKVGAGVQVFVLDTGIAPHQAHGGRVRVAPERSVNAAMLAQETPEADHAQWHGNHVTGVITATLLGVARTVRVDSMKVCNGFFSGVENVMHAHEAIKGRFQREAAAGSNPRYVINQSFGFFQLIPGRHDGAREVFAPQTVVLSMKRLARPGIYFSQAAGNDNSRVFGDACTGIGQVGRGNADDAHLMVVGAFDVHDQRAIFSNMGPCVNINAPGVEIYSSTSPPNNFAAMSGTSMAAPHVTGVMVRALIDNGDNRLPSPKKMRAFLQSLAFDDVQPYTGMNNNPYHANPVDNHRLFYYCEERKGDTFPILNAFAGV